MDNMAAEAAAELLADVENTSADVPTSTSDGDNSKLSVTVTTIGNASEVPDAVSESRKF